VTDVDVLPVGVCRVGTEVWMPLGASALALSCTCGHHGRRSFYSRWFLAACEPRRCFANLPSLASAVPYIDDPRGGESVPRFTSKTTGALAPRMTFALGIGVVLGASFLTALLCTPLARALAFRVGAVARPTNDRWHKEPTALLGGVAMPSPRQPASQPRRSLLAIVGPMCRAPPSRGQRSQSG